MFRMMFLDCGSAIVCFRIPGIRVFPEEKANREVSLMRFIKWHTCIPVTHVLHYGITAQNPAILGPFLNMEYLMNDSELVDTLNTPGIQDGDRPILDPRISEERLRSVYRQILHTTLKRLGRLVGNLHILLLLEFLLERCCLGCWREGVRSRRTSDIKS